MAVGYGDALDKGRRREECDLQAKTPRSYRNPVTIGSFPARYVMMIMTMLMG